MYVKTLHTREYFCDQKYSLTIILQMRVQMSTKVYTYDTSIKLPANHVSDQQHIGLFQNRINTGRLFT